MFMQPVVTIVIPVFNEEQYLAACLTSVVNVDYPKEKLQIILVDNGSTDNTLNIAATFNDVEVLIKKDVNVGGVRNYGAEHAKGDVLVFLDSDCVIEKGWIQLGVTKLSEGRDVVGGLYLLRDNPSWIESGWLLSSSKEHVYQKTLVGGCIFSDKSAFSAIGGFDENLSAGEDTDLTDRLIANDYKVDMLGELSVIHLGYPNTLQSFIKRQMWFAEDYYQKFPQVLTDSIFLLTHVFLLGVLLSVIGFMFDTRLSILGLGLIVFCPFVLTMKRWKRFKIKKITVELFIKAYLIDVMYICGRVLGSFRSFKKSVSNSNIKKYSRR